MMETSLIHGWSNLGITFLLTPEEDLKVLSPDGILTPHLLDELKARKPEIIQSLLEKYVGLPVSWSNAIEITLTRTRHETSQNQDGEPLSSVLTF